MTSREGGDGPTAGGRVARADTAGQEPSAADDRLHTLAATPCLLVALDFDGTLSPLVDDPMAARMLPAARDGVRALSALPCTTVAIVSGRSLPDLRIIAEHRDDSPILLAGSHGAEFWTPDDGLVLPADDPDEIVRRDRLRSQAEQATRRLAGVYIEPKSFGFGVHTRRASPADARAAFDIADALVNAQAPHWRRRSGHSIVEYAFRSEGKDSAVAWLRARTRATAVLFAGDDATDEDALRALSPRDVGVRVGGASPTAATIVVGDIATFAVMLARLAAQRALSGAIECGHV